MKFNLTMVPLFADETLSSFLSRLARANGQKLMNEFVRDLGLDPVRLRHGDETEIRRFATISGSNANQLLANAVAYESDHVLP